MKRLLNIVKTSVFMGLKSGAKLATDSVLEPADAWTLIQEEGALVIDVRSEKEVQQGILPAALHIPHNEIAQRSGEISEHKERVIVIYCAVGGRAAVAKAELEQLGFLTVFNAGGYPELLKHGTEIGALKAN